MRSSTWGARRHARRPPPRGAPQLRLPAEAMLAILNERAAAENSPITSHLLAWDDWEWEAGLGENSVDVAFARPPLTAGTPALACVKL